MMRKKEKGIKRRKLTHHGEVGGGCRWDQQAIGGHAGVVPRILWDETGDEKSSIYHDLDS